MTCLSLPPTRGRTTGFDFRECESLAVAGYEVTLIAVEGAVDMPEAAAAVIRIPKRGRLGRALLSPPRAIREALRVRPHLVHLHDPELVWAIPLLRALGKKVIYDAHEDLPVQIQSKAYLNAVTRPLAVWLARLIVAVAASSDHVIAATETIALRFPGAKVTVVHNYPPLRGVEDAPTPIAERPPTAVYIGALGWGRGLRTMIMACASPVFPDDWRTRVVGAMSDRLRFEVATIAGSDRVDFTGAVAPDDARDELLNARVGYVLFQRMAAHLDSLPTKMFEYLAAAVPVVASDFPLWREMIGDVECGILVDPADPEDVAAAIRRYADEPDLLKRHSANARRLAVERYNWTTESAALISAYVRVLGG